MKKVRIRPKTYNLCYMSALKDRNGKVFKDDKGRVKLFTSFLGVNFRIVPNPNSEGGTFEYILSIEPGTDILPGLGVEEDDEEDEKE